MTIGERIKKTRERLGMSQVDFADKINVSKQTLYKYENNIITNVPSDKVEDIAEVGRVTPSYIMGWEEPAHKGVKIPVLGKVAAGIPIEAIEEILDYEEITEDLSRTGKFFGLRIKGDSMTPIICDGDVVIVKQQNDAETNDVVIATINGDEAVCKRLRKYKDGIELISNNPSYTPYEFTNEEIEAKPVRIVGKVIELRRKF